MAGTRPLLVLDGGNGHGLRRNGVVIQGPIGSMERFLNVALANREQPEIVVKTHLEYLRAGANVITTNNYSCVPAALELSPNPSPDQITDLIERGGRLAHEACDIFQKESPPGTPRPLVAGSMPPLHESYRADRVSNDDEELTSGYALISKHIAPYADVLLCETMSRVREGLFAAEAANKLGKPVWISWTLAEDSSGCLRSGEPIEEAVAAVAHLENVEAMMFNCCFHTSIMAALPRLRKVAPAGVVLGVYANGFNTQKGGVDSKEYCTGKDDETKGSGEYEDLSAEAYAQQAHAWMKAAGISIIGGCCGIFSEHIGAVAQALKPRGRVTACKPCGSEEGGSAKRQKM